MKSFAIIGTGAVGGYYGGLLQRAGKLRVRTHHVSELRVATGVPSAARCSCESDSTTCARRATIGPSVATAVDFANSSTATTTSTKPNADHRSAGDQRRAITGNRRCGSEL